MTGAEYRVLLNQGFLLSLAIDKAFIYNHEDNETEHITFDLRTGRRLTLADVVADPPAQLSRRFDGAISRRLWDDLAGVAAEYGDSATIAYVASLYGLYDWNTPTARVPYSNTVAEVQWLLSADFALQPNALLLFHRVGIERINAEFWPDDTYTFPFARLHPRGLLIPLAKAAQAKKSVSPPR